VWTRPSSTLLDLDDRSRALPVHESGQLELRDAPGAGGLAKALDRLAQQVQVHLRHGATSSGNARVAHRNVSSRIRYRSLRCRVSPPKPSRGVNPMALTLERQAAWLFRANAVINVALP